MSDSVQGTQTTNGYLITAGFDKELTATRNDIAKLTTNLSEEERILKELRAVLDLNSTPGTTNGNIDVGEVEKNIRETENDIALLTTQLSNEKSLEASLTNILQLSGDPAAGASGAAASTAPASTAPAPTPEIDLAELVTTFQKGSAVDQAALKTALESGPTITVGAATLTKGELGGILLGMAQLAAADPALEIKTALKNLLSQVLQGVPDAATEVDKLISALDGMNPEAMVKKIFDTVTPLQATASIKNELAAARQDIALLGDRIGLKKSNLQNMQYILDNKLTSEAFLSKTDTEASIVSLREEIPALELELAAAKERASSLEKDLLKLPATPAAVATSVDLSVIDKVLQQDFSIDLTAIKAGFEKDSAMNLTAIKSALTGGPTINIEFPQLGEMKLTNGQLCGVLLGMAKVAEEDPAIGQAGFQKSLEKLLTQLLEGVEDADAKVTKLMNALPGLSVEELSVEEVANKIFETVTKLKNSFTDEELFTAILESKFMAKALRMMAGTNLDFKY